MFQYWNLGFYNHFLFFLLVFLVHLVFLRLWWCNFSVFIFTLISVSSLSFLFLFHVFLFPFIPWVNLNSSFVIACPCPDCLRLQLFWPVLYFSPFCYSPIIPQCIFIFLPSLCRTICCCSPFIVAYFCSLWPLVLPGFSFSFLHFCVLSFWFHFCTHLLPFHSSHTLVCYLIWSSNSPKSRVFLHPQFYSL